MASDFWGSKLCSESLNPLNLLNSKPKRGVVTMVMRTFHIVSRLRRPMLLGFLNSRPCIHETLQQMMKTETPLKTNTLAHVADFVTVHVVLIAIAFFFLNLQ